jgi:sigma-B regulation protein RsbU (phosphoserine phosphatase)
MSDQDFFAELRHDLANPINQIIGFAELIEEDLDDDQPCKIDDLRKIRIAAQVLQGLVKTRVKPNAVHALIEDTLEKPVEQTAAPAKVFSDDMGSSLAAVENKRLRANAPTGKILAADDDNYNLEILAKFLHKQGHVVTTVEDGVQALDALSSGKFDLVLLDIMMPNLDGFEALKRIKESDSLMSTPVIMISALDELSSVVRCIEYGAEDYLPKPYNATLLRARIGSCLERKAWVDQNLRLIDQLETSQSKIDVELKEAGKQLDELKARFNDDVSLEQFVKAFERINQSLVGQKRQIAATLQDLQIEINRKVVSAQVKSIVTNPEFVSLSDRAKAMRDRRRKHQRGNASASSETMDQV